MSSSNWQLSLGSMLTLSWHMLSLKFFICVTTCQLTASFVDICSIRVSFAYWNGSGFTFSDASRFMVSCSSRNFVMLITLKWKMTTPVTGCVV